MIIRKMNGSLFTEERETVIRYDYVEKCWYADTSVSKHITKFKKQGWEIVSQTINEQGIVQAVEFKCDNPSSITIGRAVKRKRDLTEEQRNEAIERLRVAREKKT